VGDGDAVRRDLDRYRRLGITEINIRPWFGDLPASASMETVALIGDLAREFEADDGGSPVGIQQ
jgi:hypothetical protein